MVYLAQEVEENFHPAAIAKTILYFAVLSFSEIDFAFFKLYQTRKTFVQSSVLCDDSVFLMSFA